jgi:uncharacterized protein (TIGR02996 family)
VNLQEALFRAILEEPWEDAHRLVYADWLDENGQPERGQFIRVQIARARLPANDLQEKKLLRQEKILAQGRKSTWKAELPRFKGVTWGDFERGFIGAVRFRSAYRFRQFAREVVTRAPIEVVRLASAGSLTALSKSPALARIRTLYLDFLEINDRSNIGELTRSPHLGRLTLLSLRSSRVGTGDVRALAQAKTFPRLAELDLSGNSLEDACVRWLVNSPTLAELRRLDVTQNSFSEAGKQQLRDKFGDRVIL